MAKWEVKFVTGNYSTREQEANRLNAVAYIEQHFNSVNEKSNYACVVVAHNASQTSKNMGRFYARYISDEFDVPIGGDNGILVGGYNGRGDENIDDTKMPAILLEPLFVSNPNHVAMILHNNHSGIQVLASAIVETLKKFIAPGLVCFSIGHRGKVSHPHDEGAPVVGHKELTEAELAYRVLLRAKILLESET